MRTPQKQILKNGYSFTTTVYSPTCCRHLPKDCSPLLSGMVFLHHKTQTKVMQEEIKNSSSVNNSIFKYAFIGVLLCIATFGFTLTNFASIAMHQVPQMAIVTLMGLGSIALLSKAIKGDKERLREI